MSTLSHGHFQAITISNHNVVAKWPERVHVPSADAELSSGLRKVGPMGRYTFRKQNGAKNIKTEKRILKDTPE